MANQPHIEARKYQEKALDYLRLMGIKNGDFPILEKAKHPQHWLDWIAYYRWKGMLASVDLMGEGHGSKTVPSLSPHDFDPEFSRVSPRVLPFRRPTE